MRRSKAMLVGAALAGALWASSCGTVLSDFTKVYTLSYSANGATEGAAPTDSKGYLSEDRATVLGNTGSLAKTGYGFVGWNTKADGTGTSYAEGGSLAIGTDNVALYAAWTNTTTAGITIESLKDYTVTIDGSSTASYGSEASFGSTYTGTATGYQWYLNGSAISGATAASLSWKPTVATAHCGANLLTLKVTDANGSAYSGSLTITVSK